MSSSSGIGPEQDPLEKRYRVEEIERIRWEEEKKGRFREKFLQEPARGGFTALLFLMWEKVLDFMRYSLRKGVAAEEPIREDLLLLKAAFETMMREDRSQDAPFLRRLSKLWLAMLEHSIRLQTKGEVGMQFKNFLKEIERYPEHEEHTFGYYLDEFAGQKWLPFPYMELIQKMHHQHELDPPSSPLTRWVKMIEEILQSLLDQV